MPLIDPTPYDREAVRRALHTLSAHLTAAQWQAIGKAAEACAYAGMQLGTSSQAKAHGDKMAAIDAALADVRPHYIAEMAGYIVEGRTGAGYGTNTEEG